MDSTAKTAKLEEYRARIAAGDELPPQQFALYQGLEAWEARTAGSPRTYLIISLLIFTM